MTVSKHAKDVKVGDIVICNDREVKITNIDVNPKSNMGRYYLDFTEVDKTLEFLPFNYFALAVDSHISVVS